MDPRLFVAVKALIVKDGKILVLREADTYKEGTCDTRYTAPGGRIRPGEDLLHALRREVKEETGLEVIEAEPFHFAEWHPEVGGETWHIVGIFFKCMVGDGEVQLSDEHSEYVWIEPEQHKDQDMMDNLHEAFDMYLKERA